MSKDLGVPPAGSGSQASPGAAEASPPSVSIPNALVFEVHGLFAELTGVAIGVSNVLTGLRGRVEPLVKRADEAAAALRPFVAQAMMNEYLTASAMSAGTAETQSGSGLQPASAVPEGETP